MSTSDDSVGRVWRVSSLCRAVADALNARFNPVTVSGEISGFSRASSGHCYFTLKDERSQIRCAMFRRAASMSDFSARDGDQVEVRGRVTVYEQRGDLQLVVESVRRAGQGVLLERFLQLKAKLQSQGLFDPARKRSLPIMPRGIGVVTSLGAAALHDVVSALVRRVPHIPVVIVPAAVQGAQAPGEIQRALQSLYAMHREVNASADRHVDVILLVRGGGSMEDLWAFNDEDLVQCIAASPVPVISGVGHETDFTLADFCADLRAPTPTAAAELVSQPQAVWLAVADQWEQSMGRAVQAYADSQSQRLDMAASRMGRPSGKLALAQSNLLQSWQRLKHASQTSLGLHRRLHEDANRDLPRAMATRLNAERQHLVQVSIRLQSVDPKLVLQRGYALLQDAHASPLTRVRQFSSNQSVKAILADGEVDLQVSHVAGH